MSKKRATTARNQAGSLSLRMRGWSGPGVILLAAIVAAFPLFLLGPSCSSDFAFHYISWIDAQRSMSSGILYPHWANLPNFGAGEPKFVFYPPLTWMAGAILGTLLPWSALPLIFFIILLTATGMANRALAKMALTDGSATLAGCASIFLTYALFSIYKRNDFGEMAGGFLVPLLLLFVLRRRNSSGSFWERTFDGSAAPLALVVAGIWLTNGPIGIMAAYLLAVVALTSALIEKSAVPIVRASVSSLVGMGLASIYLLPAIAERNWISIQNALNGQGAIENNWLFGLHGDSRFVANDPQLLGSSWVAIGMLLISFGGGAITWIRGVIPGERRWWLPLALIPPAVAFMLFPVSLPIWNALPELRVLQFPWRWLVVLEVPTAICFASAVWFDRKAALVAYTAFFFGISFAAPLFWFRACGTLINSLQESVRENIGVIGKPEYAPPGIRSPLTVFQVDSEGNPLLDNQGNPIPQPIPDACLLETPTTPSVVEESSLAPAWRGGPTDCKSSGWHELGSAPAPLSPAAGIDFPEQKVFMGVADHAGYAILRLRYFPAWAVKVNGISTIALGEQDRGLMAVRVPKGSVEIVVDWSTTADVIAGRFVSGIAALLAFGLFQFERRRARNSIQVADPVLSGSPKKSRGPNRQSTRPVPSSRADSNKAPREIEKGARPTGHKKQPE